MNAHLTWRKPGNLEAPDIASVETVGDDTIVYGQRTQGEEVDAAALNDGVVARQGAIGDRHRP